MIKTLKFIVLSLVLSTTVLAQKSDTETNNLVSVAIFASKIQQQAKPQIIDARSAEEFTQNHINGAINLIPQDASFIEKLNPSQPVFVYSIANGRSVVFAKDLASKGFKEVYVLDGGIGAWVGQGKTVFTTAKKGLTLNDFNNILASNKLVLVDVGSRYCGSCKKVKPVLETLRKEHGDALKIVEIDLEESPQLIASLKKVTSFPYLILYKQGKVTFEKSGIAELKGVLDTALAQAL